jgi:hypothetical protein
MEKKASNAEKNPGVTVAIAVPTTTRVPALSWQVLPTASRNITVPCPGESVILSRCPLILTVMFHVLLDRLQKVEAESTNLEPYCRGA